MTPAGPTVTPARRSYAVTIPTYVLVVSDHAGNRRPPWSVLRLWWMKGKGRPARTFNRTRLSAIFAEWRACNPPPITIEQMAADYTRSMRDHLEALWLTTL